jgi:hypothetical protein
MKPIILAVVLVSSTLLLGCLTDAAAQCYCQGCGCKGGPGWRAGDGHCVSYKDLTKICGTPPSNKCTYEGATKVCPSERRS